MKDFDVAAVFCEMLSGLATLIVLTVWLDVADQLSFGAVLKWLEAHSDLGTVAALLAVAYFVGILIDAAGMAFDSLIVGNVGWLARLLCYDAGNLPADFYATSSEHRLKFWAEQWAYFSCYRNLLLLAPLGIPGTLIVAQKYGGCGWVTVVGVASVVVLIALTQSIRDLQKIMVRVARAS